MPLLILRRRKQGLTFRRRWTSALPMWRSRLSASNARSIVYGKSPESSMPSHLTTRLPSKFGYAVSARKSPKPQRKVVSLVSEACKLATPRRPLWPTSRRRWALPFNSGLLPVPRQRPLLALFGHPHRPGLGRLLTHSGHARFFPHFASHIRRFVSCRQEIAVLLRYHDN